MQVCQREALKLRTPLKYPSATALETSKQQPLPCIFLVKNHCLRQIFEFRPGKFPPNRESAQRGPDYLPESAHTPFNTHSRPGPVIKIFCRLPSNVCFADKSPTFDTPKASNLVLEIRKVSRAIYGRQLPLSGFRDGSAARAGTAGVDADSILYSKNIFRCISIPSVRELQLQQNRNVSRRIRAEGDLRRRFRSAVKSLSTDGLS